MGLFHSLVVRSLHFIPKPILRKLSDRYIAGDTLEEAVKKAQVLQARGFSSILDVLGEDTETQEEALRAVDDYKRAVAAAGQHRLQTYVSIKPTQFGLRRSASDAEKNYRAVLDVARGAKIFTRVEMEDHTTTDGTIALFDALRRDYADVGIVIQAYLRRTLQDLRRLVMQPGKGRLNVRLCKGIYVEPHAIAWKDPFLINENYRRGLEILLGGGAFVSVATHDERIVFDTLEVVDRLGLSKQDFEFAMLLGVMEPLRDMLLAQGYPVRVYIPYGPQWRPYSLRRLRRNPALLGAVMRASLGLKPKASHR
ncbi:MAG: proline dehydrogenase family protein [Planctomycetes bacterium]|nr:proline dehydrogenase family protein [Planctomycetota bacterium]